MGCRGLGLADVSEEDNSPLDVLHSRKNYCLARELDLLTGQDRVGVVVVDVVVEVVETHFDFDRKNPQLSEYS